MVAEFQPYCHFWQLYAIDQNLTWVIDSDGFLISGPGPGE